MATKNIVPNADTEGQLGTSTKGWGKIFLGGAAANIDVNNVSGTNTAGKSLTLISGASTGSGAGGSIVFQTAAAGGSGTSVNSHATVLTLDSAKLATFAGGIVSTGKITADAGIDIDNFNIDGTTISLSSGTLTLDAVGQVHLDSADEGSVQLKRSGTSYGLISSNDTSNNIGPFTFKSVINDKDIVFQGVDNNTGFTALTLDMSEAGAASFSGNILLPRAFNDTSSTLIYVDSALTGSGVSTYQGSLLLQAGGDGSASYGAGLRLHGHAHASKPGSAEVGLSAADGAKFTINNFGAGGGAELFKVERDNGNATVSLGNLVIATAGKGIDFSAETPSGAGAAGGVGNILDDYEEGTWTPTFGGLGSGSVGYTSDRGGLYTKVGRKVTVIGVLLLNAMSSADGDTTIQGLPFTVDKKEKKSVAGITIGIIRNSTQIVLTINASNAGYSSFQSNTLKADTNLYFTATYFTAT